MKKSIFFLILIFILLANIFPQEDILMANFRQGITYYSQGNWVLAIDFLEPALRSTNRALAAEAHFWTAMSRFSNNEFLQSLENMETILMYYPDYHNINELNYHKGRALFNLGFFNDSILTFNDYLNTLGPDNFLDTASLDRKASTLFWIGECLFNMGHLDRAEDTFSLVIMNYPESSKFEASSFRIALIGQKRVEEELLRLLRLSHEEARRNLDEFQRRETAYEHAIIIFQNRINDLESDTRLADLETDNAMYELELALSEERIRILEARLLELEQVQQTTAVQDSPRQEFNQGLPVKTPGIWDNQLK